MFIDSHLMMYNKNKEEYKSPGAAGPPPPSPPPPPPMSPRISFSNDFVEAPTSHHSHQQTVRNYYRDAPVSSDFEFSVSNYDSMNMSADELFSHGRLLPLKESIIRKTTTTTTLRDELEVVDDYEDEDEDDDLGFSLRPPRNSNTATCTTRWKGFLGLRKSHIGSKKMIDTQGSAHLRSASLPHFVLSSKPASQDKNIDEGSSNSIKVEYRH